MISVIYHKVIKIRFLRLGVVVSYWISNHSISECSKSYISFQHQLWSGKDSSVDCKSWMVLILGVSSLNAKT